MFVSGIVFKVWLLEVWVFKFNCVGSCLLFVNFLFFYFMGVNIVIVDFIVDGF